MSNPVQIRVRGTDEVKRQFEHANAEFQMLNTQAELIIALSQYAMENDEDFRRYVRRRGSNELRDGHRRS